VFVFFPFFPFFFPSIPVFSSPYLLPVLIRKPWFACENQVVQQINISKVLQFQVVYPMVALTGKDSFEQQGLAPGMPKTGLLNRVGIIKQP
jgi:hypothetical protein